MSLAKPKITTQTVSPQAVAPAPAAQGADALRLGVTGDPLDDELLNGRSSALLGKLRLRVGRPGADVLNASGGIGSTDIARAGGVGAGSTGSATTSGAGSSSSGSSSTGTTTAVSGSSSFQPGSKLRIARQIED